MSDAGRANVAGKLVVIDAVSAVGSASEAVGARRSAGKTH